MGDIPILPHPHSDVTRVVGAQGRSNEVPPPDFFIWREVRTHLVSKMLCGGTKA